LRGARRHRLGGLSPEESVAMLRAVLGEGRVDGDVAAAREVARACAGLPLALRAAGARLLAQPGLTLRDLARGVHTGRLLVPPRSCA
ncbi:MAG TPA: hypothetical protein VHJ17_09615, partial [Thermomonospora sp.]|nr:hypothetical protein [Thermomonospora sp.]